MKKSLLAAVAALAFVVAGAVSWTATAGSESFQSGDSVVVGAEETIDRTLFAAGNTVEIAGTVDGDVFCAGQTVTITGTVRGDVICAGQAVEIDGTIEGDVRTAGQTVTLAGDVEGNVTATGQTFTMKEEATANDVSVGASVVKLNGEVERDVYAGAESFTVNGTIGRDVMADAAHVGLNEDARILGNLSYPRSAQFNKANGAQIVGDTSRYESEQPKEDAGLNAGQAVGSYIIGLIMLLVVAIALVALFPRVFQHLSDWGVRKPGMTFLVGLVAVLLTPIAIIGLTITLLGILFGLVLAVAYVLVLAVSGPVAGYYLGRMLLNKYSTNPLSYMLLGATILALLYFVPILGGIVMLLAAMFGTGMILHEVFHRGRNITYDVSLMNAKPVKAKK